MVQASVGLDQAVVDGGHHGRLAPCDPAFRVDRRQIGTRKLRSVRKQYVNRSFLSANIHVALPYSHITHAITYPAIS